jgi:F-box protein 11
MNCLQCTGKRGILRQLPDKITLADTEETKVSHTPLAFLSYVNLDDQHEQGRLTQFRERLSGEVRMQTGESFDIFQDRKHIVWGQPWQERLDSSLAAVTFLLPIITPAFFKSDACRAELERFLKREKELGRGDLILPIYYVNCLILEDKEELKHDPLAQIIAARQYEDWRDLRYEEFSSQQVRKSLAKMAQQIAAALKRSRKESARTAAVKPADAVKEAPTSKQPEKERAESDSQSNTFKSGGGGQSNALGDGAIGTQNIYYGTPPTPPDRPKPKTRMCRAIVTGLFMSAALLFVGILYIDDLVKLSKLHTAKVLPVQTQPVQAETVKVAPAKTELSTVLVDQQGKGDYATITEALKAVKAGGKIVVRPGLYKEGIVIDKPVEIIGDGDRNDIVIEATGKHTVVFQADSGRLANLTLRQAGGGDWYGIDITQGRLALEDCDISSQSRAGVAIHGSANPTMRRNRIHDGELAGVSVFADGKGTLEDNEIFANAFAGVAITTGGNPTLRRNRIHDGKSDGVFVYKDGKGTLEDNEIFANALAGVAIMTGGNPTLRSNRITKNGWEGIRVYSKGGGTFEDNDLRGNTKGAWNITADSKALVQRKGNQE